MARINRLKIMPAEALRKWRAKHRLTQLALSDLLGVDSRTISKWENEETTIPPLLPLALEALERREQDALAPERKTA